MTGAARHQAQRRRVRPWAFALVLAALLLAGLSTGPTPPWAGRHTAVDCATSSSEHDCSPQLTASASTVALVVRPVRRDLAPRPLPAVPEHSVVPTSQGSFVHGAYPRPPTSGRHDAAPSLTRRGPPAQAEH